MRKPKVLVVDDDSQIRSLLGVACEKIGYECQMASNGLEALTLLKATTYSLVISDMRMPIMDGMDLVRNLAELKIDVPVILITGDFEVQDQDISHFKRVEILLKPFNRKQLKEAVERLLAT